MTNTLHRQGPAQELERDYVIFATTARDINRQGSAPKIQEFTRICLKHGPVNIGSGKLGNIHQDDVDIHELISKQGDGAGAAAVFADLDTLKEVVAELVQADLGISINISGLLEGVQECCRSNGIERHSVEQSLGFWGARDRLPEREILAYNTMCGHGMVSFSLIRKMIEYVKLRRLTPREAARMMGKCCECGVFNTDRAEALLDKLLDVKS
jgi:hypothetical protein